MIKIINGDCLKELDKLNGVDLAIIDPPYSIGYKYDVYKDNTTKDEYLDFSQKWIQKTHKSLKPNGTFWLISGSKYASELDIICKQYFHRRQWCIWNYNFGQNSQKNFSPCFTHLLYYVKDKNNFTFNGDSIRVPSARQLKYKDKRANLAGKIPDNVWMIPRVCGTFKERVMHSCQLPLQLTDRIVKACSNEGDLILDPMCGSGTVLLSAKNLNRNAIGIELSKDYCKVARERLK